MPKRWYRTETSDVALASQRGIEARVTVLRAEHEMDDDEAQGLQHGGRSMGRAFSPSSCFFAHTWAVGPGWDGARLWRWGAGVFACLARWHVEGIFTA